MIIKLLGSEQFLRRIVNLVRPLQLSTVSAPAQDSKLKIFRCEENDPLKHTPAHVGQFYKIEDDDKYIFLHGGLSKAFEMQAKTFNEHCLMVRKPAVDIITCLKAIDYSKPAVRFVLFGKKGTGKTMTLAHVLHYAHRAGYMLVHVPWVPYWMKKCKESSSSETKEGFVDLNLDAAAWLVHFKCQNEHLLAKPELKISQDIVWSKRETTPKEAPLSALIDHGINRLKYASECVIALAEEIKYLSRAGHCKTLVAIDGFNSFFYPKTRIYKEKKEVVPPHKVTLTEAFLNLTKFDWHNSAIVVTVDELVQVPEDDKGHLPRCLLGKEGFEHLDPFVPVHVDNYSPKEFLSCMEYYRERKWVRPYPQQDEELSLLSVNNPYSLMQLVSSL